MNTRSFSSFFHSYETYIIAGVIFLWVLFQSAFLPLNEVLKVADSFAYLQMADFITEGSIHGLGTGWFGFTYSSVIALSHIFFSDIFIAAQVINLFLCSLSFVLIYCIGRKFLSPTFALWGIILFTLSPSFYSFTIHILSENIYIPLFLLLFYQSYIFIEKHETESLFRLQMRVIFLGFLLWVLYLTRAEAFIYLLSFWIIALNLFFQKKLSWKRFFLLGSLCIMSFFIFISPYLFYLHGLTGEWGLTNKWASNLRQAELRGKQEMDDAGFEKAVAELTEDKMQLISWFAGGMPYVSPKIEENFQDTFTKDPGKTLKRVIENQRKLFQKNIPEIILWNGPHLFFEVQSPFHKNIFFFLWCFLPLGVIIYWLLQSYKKYGIFMLLSLWFFLPALLFFTLFFILNRYFIIFLPLFFLFFLIGIQEIKGRKALILQSFFLVNLISILLLSGSVYYNTEKTKDSYYELKKEAWFWLAENTPDSKNIKILERFPISTYYSGARWRYITPYSNNVEDIIYYAQANEIQYLIADSMDFLKYRPELSFLLSETPKNLILLKEFENKEDQKVKIFQIPPQK